MAKKLKSTTTSAPKQKIFLFARYSADQGDYAAIYKAETVEQAIAQFVKEGNDPSTLFIGELTAAGFVKYEASSVYTRATN